MIYKILRAEEWKRLNDEGTFEGSPKDLEDGFIHCSTGAQVPETAVRYFKGETGLMLAEIDMLNIPDLKWERSRGGDLFPHIYGLLELEDVVRSWPLPLGADGRHIFPADSFAV